MYHYRRQQPARARKKSADDAAVGDTGVEAQAQPEDGRASVNSSPPPGARSPDLSAGGPLSKKRRLNPLPLYPGTRRRTHSAYHKNDPLPPFLSRLCVEITSYIFMLLDVESRCRAARVCKAFRSVLINDRSYWSFLDLSGREPRDVCLRTADLKISRIVYQAPHIFRNVRDVDLSHSSVSTAVTLLCERCPEIRSLNLSSCSEVDSRTVMSLYHARKLTKLSLMSCPRVGNYAVMELAAWVQGLQELNLSYNALLTEECLRSLVTLTDLRVLDLTDCIGIQDWSPLLQPMPEGRPHLTSLALPGNEQVTDDQLARLAARYPQLKSLTIFVDDIRQVNGEALVTMIGKLDKLEALDLAISNEEALQAAIPAFPHVANLDLDICYGRFSEDTVRQLALTASNLTSLCFYNNVDEGNAFNISDGTLALITDQCPRLRRLQLFCEELSASGLRAVTRLQELTHLDLTSPKLSNSTMKHLASNLPRLTTLILLMPEKATRDTSICNLFRGLSHVTHVVLFLDTFTDADLQHLGMCCPKLQHLELSTNFNIPFTLEGLAEHCHELTTIKLAQEKAPPARIRSYKYLQAPFVALARRSRKLQRIAIVGSLLTDTSLLALAEIPRLHTLHIENCLSVTKGGILEFAARAKYLQDIYSPLPFPAFDGGDEEAAAAAAAAVGVPRLVDPELIANLARLGVRVHGSEEEGMVWHGP